MAHRSEEQPPRDLYTIPVSSSWFNWDSIHETERRSLPEFFDNSSYSRNPRVYKEYRDFMINKFREDPCRRLTFTEVRKSLLGDVGSVEKVFRWLDRWGLINFGVEGVEEEEAAPVVSPVVVVVEKGPPAGVKVVPASAAAVGRGGGRGRGESGFRLPALSSYSDVFGDGMVRKGPVCGVCGNHCSPGPTKSVKGGYAVCSKCSENKSNKEEKSVDNLKANKNVDGSGNHVNNVWTEPETLLLLEAVLKHGDDWDLIAQHVRTKNKLDCIARLIHLPFGEHMLGPIRNKLESSRNSGSEEAKAIQLVLKEQSEEPIKSADEQHTTDTDEQHTDTDEKKKVEEESSPSRPTKKRCLPSLTDVTDSLTTQVALLSTVAGPDIAAAAAEAAVTALCHENPCAQTAFQINEDEFANKFGLSIEAEMGNNLKSEDQEMKRHKQTESLLEKSFGATTFRIRAAIATSLGAAAARAKLLADQELREMELLMASIIETQLKKIKNKMKHFDGLEFIMEEEYSQIQQLKESILEEWVGILQQATHAGIPRWKDNGLPKLLLNTNL